MLKKGDVATVYHAGSDSYYEATLIRKVSRQELIAVGKASAGEDPRTDTTLFKDVVEHVLHERPTVYNDVNGAKTKRRLKAACVYPSDAELAKLRIYMRATFGDRLLDMGVTTDRSNGERMQSTGGELYIKLTAY